MRSLASVLEASLFLLAAVGLSACSGASDCPALADELRAGDDLLCEAAGYLGRDYLLHVPDAYDGETPMPLVLSLHGSGFTKESHEQLTCPDGDEESAACLTAMAKERGYLLASLDGQWAWQRFWNANGRPTAGDDVAYVETVLDDIRDTVSVDDARVYSVGFSAGGAMTHSLACQLAGTFAAVASVGASRHLAAEDCVPARPIGVLEIHGDEDTWWPIEGRDDGLPGVEATMVGTEEEPGWARLNQCSTVSLEETLDDLVDDGTRAVKRTYPDCDDDVEVATIVIEGGGHTWPQGHQWQEVDSVGRVSQDLSANQTILDFLSGHRAP